ncbi:hypothetical protein L916_16562 [Phytophthora nicotianae]|uniref:Uncharacterized protein n=1 Tax=Phytophthora nicotianae TaxID=4792 RepID=W2I8M8_PHYNI|nr:hypothetical protein L916_16562 [Phytophthora nicotianae]
MLDGRDMPTRNLQKRLSGSNTYRSASSSSERR